MSSRPPAVDRFWTDWISAEADYELTLRNPVSPLDRLFAAL